MRRTTRLSLLLIYTIKNLGYLTILLTSAMTSLPWEYREVFRLDSSSEFHYATRVLIPAIAPMLLFFLVIAVMDAVPAMRKMLRRGHPRRRLPAAVPAGVSVGPAGIQLSDERGGARRLHHGERNPDCRKPVSGFGFFDPHDTLP